MTIQNKRLIGILLTVAFILLLPLIAMQFTDEVDWKLPDFVIMGVLLLGTGLMCELVLRKVKKIKYRVAICGLLLVALFLIWAELAVGIFGTPFAGSWTVRRWRIFPAHHKSATYSIVAAAKSRYLLALYYEFTLNFNTKLIEFHIYVHYWKIFRQFLLLNFYEPIVFIKPLCSNKFFSCA